MKCRLALVMLAIFLLTSMKTFAQQGTSPASPDAFSESPTDVAFWEAYWGTPRVVLFGPEQEAFNQNAHDIIFPFDVYDNPLNANVLDDNVQWLKDHANDRFYIEGYASVEGELGYNLDLAKQRADWVKQALISKGIPENRIVLAVPWGPLYPACNESTEECRSKNRVVRLIYSPS